MGAQDGKLPNQPIGQTLPPKAWHRPEVALQQMTMGGLQLLTEAHVTPTPCHTPVQRVCAATIVQMFTPVALTVQHAPHVGMQVAGGRQVPPAV